MEIKIIENKGEWEKLAITELTQSWVWGEFLREYGIKTWNLGVYDNGSLVAVALARVVPSRFRRHICVTNGPILDKSIDKRVKIKEILITLNSYLTKLAKEEKCSFFRIEFPFKESQENSDFIKSLGYRRSGMSVQAEADWILDISKNSEILLSEMRKSTRYEIKKSEKDGVKVIINDQLSMINEVGDFDKFWGIFEQTFKRQGFVAFPKGYLQKQLEVLSKDGKYLVALAFDKEKLLAGALFAVHAGTIHYLQAASADLPQAELKSAAKLILWKAIEKAKELKCTKLDFHGIAPNDDPKHPWYGITQFKKSFGGYEVRRLGAYDYAVNPWYNVVRFMETNSKLFNKIRKFGK